MGQRSYFTERLSRQRLGHGRLYVASVAGEIVGDVYASLEEADEDELRENLAEVPLLQHLEVRAAHRNQGIGTALIDAVEDFVRRLGRTRLALGVGMDNHGAIRLYQKLDYHEWDLSPITTFREFREPDGSVRREPDRCRILVKDLFGDPVPND